MWHLKVDSRFKFEKYSRLLMIALLLLSVVYSTSQASPLSEQIKFDGNGRVIEKISSGRTKTRFKYNEQGLPVEIKYPKGFVRYAYDQNGNRTLLENEHGKTEYVYDAFDRLTQVVSHYGPVKTVRFEYDPWNRISLIEILEKNKIIYKISYGYDILGNIVLVDGGVGKITYEYDLKKGSVIRVFPNGVKSTFLYSSLGELTSLEHKDAQGRLIASYQYDYDVPGRISGSVEKVGGKVTTKKYEWNKRGFLGKANFSDGDRVEYQYDTMGRVLSASNSDKTFEYKYDAFGRLLSAGGTRYEWNKEGQVVSQKENSDRTRFRYDGRNLPALIIAPDTIIRYRWDGDGNLVSKRVGKEVRHYLPNPLAPAGFTLAEFDNKGHLKASYLYAGLDLVGVHEADGYKFTLGDGLGHIRHTADPRGKIKAIGVPATREIQFPLIFEYRRSAHRRDRLVKAFLRKGQRLSMPSDKAIQKHDRYWTEGRYWNEDPYYKTINALSPGSKISQKSDLRSSLYDQGYVNALGIPLKLSPHRDQASTFWAKSLTGNGISLGFEWLEKGPRSSRLLPYNGPINSVLGFVDPVSKQAGRVVFSKGPLLTWEDIEGYAGSTLNIIGGGIGASYSGVGGAIVGGYLSQGLQKGVAYLATFYGTRMNRPYSWLSPMKWMSLEEYLDARRKADLGPSSRGRRVSNLDFFKKIEARLGGVDLSAEPLPAEDLKIGRLKALVYDRKGERLVLVGDEELEIPSIRVGDLAEALDIVSRPDCTPRHQCPAFTLEPAEKKYPDSPAALIGITSGDVLTNFNNAKIREYRGLLNELKAIAHDLSRKLENKLKENKKNAGSIFIYKSYPIRFVRNKKEFEDQITIQINKPYKYKTLKGSQLLEQMLGIVLNYSEKAKIKGLLVKSVKGEMLVKDYIPDWIEEKEIGRIMFVSDWLLKEYSFGVKFVTGKGKNTLEQKERNSDVEGYLSATDISLLRTGANSQIASNRQESRNRLLQWMSERLKKKCPQLKVSIEDLSRKSDERMRARMWIEVKERRVNLHRYNDSVWVDEPNMIVKAMRQEHDPQRGLYDVESGNPVSKAFAKEFTCFYDDFSQDSDSGYYGASIDLYRLKEYTKALVIARWLKELGFENQDDWINRSIFKKKTDPTLIRAILTNRKFGKTEYFSDHSIRPSVRYFGGVDLRVVPNYIGDVTKISTIEKVVMTELKKGVSGRFRFTSNGTKYTAVVIPLNKRQKKAMLKVREVNGVRYEMGENGKIIKTVSPDGAVASYGYDPSGKLSSVEIQNKKGWKIRGNKSVTGSIWTVKNLLNNKFTYQYDNVGSLKTLEVDGQKWADYQYDGKRRQLIIKTDNYSENFTYDPSGKIKNYEVHDLRNNRRDRLRFTYNHVGNLTTMGNSVDPLVKISYQASGEKPVSVASPLSEIIYQYDSDGNIREIRHSSGLSEIYHYKDNQLSRVQIAYNGNRMEYLFDENGMIQSRGFDSGMMRYNYSEGKITTVAFDEYGKIEYDYDNADRIQAIHFPDGNRIEYQYGQHNKFNDENIVKAIFHPSSTKRTSSPVVSGSSLGDKKNNTNVVLTERLEDDLLASRGMTNGLILDHYRDQVGVDHVSIVDSNGGVQKLNQEDSREWRWLVHTTTRIVGLPGDRLSQRWKSFYDKHLSGLTKPAKLEFLGKRVTLKPRMVIRSNEVDYKYAALEKVSYLKNNYIISISQQDSASKLIEKTLLVPKIKKDNVVFAIRLPEMSKKKKQEWVITIDVLRKKIGRKNVFFDPSKNEFEDMLNTQGKDIIIIELTHTNKGVVLRGGEQFSSKDILKGDDLSHIRYLITGGGCCQFPRIEKGDLVASLREKGVGLINASYRDIPADVALRRFEVLIDIISEIENYDFPSDYLLDIIDQLLGLENNGTTNLGRNSPAWEGALG